RLVMSAIVFSFGGVDVQRLDFSNNRRQQPNPYQSDFPAYSSASPSAICCPMFVARTETEFRAKRFANSLQHSIAARGNARTCGSQRSIPVFTSSVHSRHSRPRSRLIVSRREI